MADTTYKVIRDFILAKLGTITKLAEVSGAPELAFSSYPSAIIVPSEGSSDYETNAEHERIYAFDIIVYDESKKQGTSAALASVMDAVDDVLDAFAGDQFFLSPSAISLPNGAQFINSSPVAAGWGNVNAADKELLGAVVKLRCRVIVSSS